MIYQAAQGEDLLHAQAVFQAQRAHRQMFFVLGPRIASPSHFLHFPALPLLWARVPQGFPAPCWCWRAQEPRLFSAGKGHPQGQVPASELCHRGAAARGAMGWKLLAIEECSPCWGCSGAICLKIFSRNTWKRKAIFWTQERFPRRMPTLNPQWFILTALVFRQTLTGGRKSKGEIIICRKKRNWENSKILSNHPYCVVCCRKQEIWELACRYCGHEDRRHGLGGEHQIPGGSRKRHLLCLGFGNGNERG